MGQNGGFSKRKIPIRHSLGQIKTVRLINKKKPLKIAISLVWCHQESNRGHKDFQSFALPTEL